MQDRFQHLRTSLQNLRSQEYVYMSMPKGENIKDFLRKFYDFSKMICQYQAIGKESFRIFLKEKNAAEYVEAEVLPAKQVDGVRMRELGDLIQGAVPGLGFALLTFELGTDNHVTPANYISNGTREDMIKFLEETLARWKKGTDYPTPTNN